MRVELSDGQWAEIRDIDELRDGDRKAVNRSVKVEVTDDGTALLPGDHFDTKRDNLMARLITDWSFKEKAIDIPSRDPEALDKLSLKHARELHAAIQGHWDELFSDQGPEKRGTVPTSA